MENNNLNEIKENYNFKIKDKNIIYLKEVFEEIYLLNYPIRELTYKKFLEIITESDDFILFLICDYINDIIYDNISISLLGKAKILIYYYKKLLNRISYNIANELEKNSFELINNKNKQYNFDYINILNRTYLKNKHV